MKIVTNKFPESIKKGEIKKTIEQEIDHRS